jgi:hypothetical protein
LADGDVPAMGEGGVSMFVRPKVGDAVLLRYAESKRRLTAHHGRPGVVLAVSRGPGPRNHLIGVDGRPVVVPCGHLMPPSRRDRDSCSREVRHRRCIQEEGRSGAGEGRKVDRLVLQPDRPQEDVHGHDRQGHDGASGPSQGG